MGSLSAGDLALLRTERETQYSELRLYGWGRPEMWTGLVNDGSIVRGAQTIVYNTGSLQGDFAYADIVGDLLVLFGTAQGDDSIGRARLLSISGTATAGTIIIEWNDQIELTDDDTITIIHDYVLGPRFPHFTSSPTAFLKDGPGAAAGGDGVVYTDQNSEPPPLVIMGSHAVKDIPVGNPVAPSSAWWLTDTVTPSDVVAVYQFVGAVDANAALINLANPGTNDLVAIGAPTWSQATGFTYTAAQGHDTGITAIRDLTTTMRLENDVFGYAFGLSDAATNAQYYIRPRDISPGFIDMESRIGNRTRTDSAALGGAANGLTGTQPDIRPSDGLLYQYGRWDIKSGAFVWLLSGTLTSFIATAETLYIGAANDNLGAVKASSFVGYVMAVAIYNRATTDAEQLEIDTAMGALTSSTPPPGFLYCDASQTQPVATGATNSSYAWTHTPSGAVGSFADATAAQTWFYPDPTQARRYYLHCAVADSNGKTGLGNRKFISDDPAASLGYTEFNLSPITERKGQISVRATVTPTSPDIASSTAIRPEIDWDDFPDEGTCIITKTTTYGSTQKEISFRDAVRYTDRLNIYYCGQIVSLTDSPDSSSGTGEIAMGLSTIPDRFMYSLSLTGVQSPSAWYQMQSDLMYVGGTLFHLLKYHTTFAENADLIFDWTDTVKRSAVEFWTEGPLLSKATTTALQNGRLMSVTGTATGELFVEHPTNLLTTLAARNAVTTVITLEDKDATGTIRVREIKETPTSQLYADGGISSGIMGSWSGVRSISQDVRIPHALPAAPSFRQLMVASQVELNQLTGRFLTVLNREIQEMTFTFSGEYSGLFSPAGQEWTNTGTEIFATSKQSNLRLTTDFNSLRMTPTQVTKTFDNTEGRETVSVTFEVEAPEGLIGRTVPIIELPPRYVPSTRANDIGIPTPPVPERIFVTGDKTNGVEILDPVALTWSARNDGLSTDAKKVHWLTVSPYWWLMNENSDSENAILWIATEDGIYTTKDFGRSWLNRTPTDAEFPGGFLPAGVGAADFIWVSADVYGITTDIDRIVAIQGIYDNSGTWLTINGLSTNRGYTWTLAEEDAGGSDEIKGLGLLLDMDSADHLFVNYLNVTDSELFVGKRTTALAVDGADESFAACTEAELNAETYRLELYTRRDPSVTNHDEVTFGFGEFQKV